MSRTKEQKNSYDKKYYKKNKKYFLKCRKEYYQNNKLYISIKRKEYRQNHKEKIATIKKKYYQKNKEKIKNYIKKYRTKNYRKYIDYFNKYFKTRRKIDPKFRLDSNMGTAVWLALQGKKTGQKWEKLVNYSLDNLMKHLEKQFDNKMNWDNYGSYWWVDHIKPKSLFKYESAEDPEFIKCWSLENLQPLEKIANIKKGNKYKKGITFI